MIPEAAVEAAAKRAWLDSALGRRTCDAWEALTELEQLLRKDDARRILEAAAPHIAAQVLEGAAKEIIAPGASSVASAWLNTRANMIRPTP